MKRSLSVFLILVLPATLIYTVFMFSPLILSLGSSFFQWNGFGPKTFVGINNFIKLFTVSPFKDRFFNALLNNTQFFITTMIVQNMVALYLARLICKELKFHKFFRTVFFAPTTVSVIIVGYLWTLIYNPMWGSLNKALGAVGLTGLQKAWLGEPSTALTCVAVANAWQYIGVPMMLFIAGFQGISHEIIEASHIDGCTSWQQFRHVTFPLILPVVYIVSILTFVGNFSAFEIIFAMEGTLAGPTYHTDILGTFFYRTAYGALTVAVPDMGLGAAIAACMFIIISVCVGIWYRLSSKNEAY